MKYAFLAIAFAVTVISNGAQANEMNEGFVLLKYNEVEIYQGTKEIVTVKFTGCERTRGYHGCANPKAEKLQILVNDKVVEVPKSLLQRIEDLYTNVAFSYYTKGILSPAFDGPICAMGGPSTGSILEAYYHHNAKNNQDIYNVEKSEMTKVSVEPSNCKWTERVYPKNKNSADAAIRLRTILQTLGTLYR